MTTSLRNILFIDWLVGFLRGETADPRPAVAAIARCLTENGPGWIATDEGKALLYTVIWLAYGPEYTVTATTGYALLHDLYYPFRFMPPFLFQYPNGGGAGQDPQLSL